MPPGRRSWKTNGKIASLLDLRSGLMRVEPSVSLVIITSKDRGFQFTEEWRTASEISKTVSLDYLGLYMSNGYEYQFAEERLGKAMKNDAGHPFY